MDGWIKCESWKRYRFLHHGFSSRPGGTTNVYGRQDDLNLGFTPEDPSGAVTQNRARAVAGAADAGFNLATVKQVHGKRVLFASGPGQLGEADALVTDRRELLLGILTADCVPVLLADENGRAVAAAHAGWRGTLAGVTTEAVGKLVELGPSPEQLIAAIGPSIGPCCYPVSAEISDAFRSRFGEHVVLPGDHLDLRECNRQLLREAGLRPDCITAVGECTACTRLPNGAEKYFSHRAQQGRTGRMMALIGISSR